MESGLVLKIFPDHKGGMMYPAIIYTNMIFIFIGNINLNVNMRNVHSEKCFQNLVGK